MTEHVNEKTLALCSTGDLEAHEVKLVAQHVDDCAVCRERLAGFEHLQQIFSGLHTTEPAPGDLRELRSQTMRAIESNTTRWRAWWASAAAAAIALIILFHVNRVPTNEIHPPGQSLIALETPERVFRLEIPVRVAARERTLPRRPAPGLRSIALVAAAGPEPAMKITTSDPNIVILLPPDSPSEERTETND